MGRRAKRVLRTESSSCLFCQAETQHDVIMTGVPRLRLFGKPSGDVRVRAVCRRCGGYRVVPAADASGHH